MEKKEIKTSNQNYFCCSVCGKKISRNTVHIGNIYNDSKKCLKCGLGITTKTN
jgi:hypothetical protein